MVKSVNADAQINIQELEELMAIRDWNCSRLAREIGVSSSYLWRVLNGEKSGGGKLIVGILAFCQREGLDPTRFISLPTAVTAASRS